MCTKTVNEFFLNGAVEVFGFMFVKIEKQSRFGTAKQKLNYLGTHEKAKES